MICSLYRQVYNNLRIFLIPSRETSSQMLGENQENLSVMPQNRSKTPTGMKQTRRENNAHSNTTPSKCDTQSRAPLGDISSKICNLSISGNGLDGDTSEKTKTIVVEGNIGSGKSTLLKYFSHKDDIEVFPEPVHKWKDNKGQNLLDLFYKDPSRWSFAFESYAQFTRLQVHEAQTNCRYKLMERSIYSGKYCFTENLYKSEQLKRPEYNVLCEWFDWLITTKDLHIDYIVYLRSTPELCERRIIQRSRTEESGIPLEYLRDLHETHEDWLIRKTKFQLPAPVLVLDATKPLDEMVNQFKCLEDKILPKTL